MIPEFWPLVRAIMEHPGDDTHKFVLSARLRDAGYHHLADLAEDRCPAFCENFICLVDHPMSMVSLRDNGCLKCKHRVRFGEWARSRDKKYNAIKFCLHRKLVPVSKKVQSYVSKMYPDDARYR